MHFDFRFISFYYYFMQWHFFAIKFRVYLNKSECQMSKRLVCTITWMFFLKNTNIATKKKTEENHYPSFCPVRFSELWKTNTNYRKVIFCFKSSIFGCDPRSHFLMDLVLKRTAYFLTKNPIPIW